MNAFSNIIIALFFLVLALINILAGAFIIGAAYVFFSGCKKEGTEYEDKEFDQPRSELKGEENSVLQDEEDES